MATVWQQYGISFGTAWIGRWSGDAFGGQDAEDALNAATQKRLSLHFRISSNNHINEKTNNQYFSIKHRHYACIVS